MAWMSITKVNKTTGAETPLKVTTDNMAPIAHLPDGAFSDLEMYLNGYKVTGSLNYRHVYIQLLKTICFNKSSMRSYMSLENGRVNDGDDCTGLLIYLGIIVSFNI